MTKKLGLAVLVCLTAAGTAFADEGNYRPDADAPAVPAPVEPTGPVTTPPTHLMIDRDIAAPLALKGEAIYIGGLDLTLPTAGPAHEGAPAAQLSIAAEEDIALCSSLTCRKKFQFVISCTGADAQPVELRSPWFRNYATMGKMTKTYTFAALPLAQCTDAPTVTFDVKLGWDGTMPYP